MRKTLFRCNQFLHSKPIRIYRYAIDHHGQVFLHDVKPKNLTSCIKDLGFLDYFLTRVRPNDVESYSSSINLTLDWTEKLSLNLEEACSIGKLQNYNWISPCNKDEINLIRSTSSPIVFKELTKDGFLKWAGNQFMEFNPNLLKFDIKTGYLYHPSPIPTLKSLKMQFQQGNHPFGNYSLVSSYLILQNFSNNLEFHDKGGTIEWKGKRFSIDLLEEKDLNRSRHFNVLKD